MSRTVLLPIFNNLDFKYTITLNSVGVTLRFRWNTKTKHYHMDVYLRDGTMLLEGRKVVVGTSILSTAMYVYGIKGYFLLSPADDKIEDNEDNRKNWADKYALAFIT